MLRLTQQWQVPCRHCTFHHSGTWYWGIHCELQPELSLPLHHCPEDNNIQSDIIL